MRDFKFAQTSYDLSAYHKLFCTKDASCDRHTIMACIESVCTHCVHLAPQAHLLVGRVCVVPLQFSEKVCPVITFEPQAHNLIVR